MGVEKRIIVAGSGARPRAGQKVVMQYTGWLKDTTQPDDLGTMFDSSATSGDLEVEIGMGRAIRGWDEAVLTMKLGERARLDITSDYAYGERGFHGHIPANADLIFEVYLVAIR